MKVFSLDYVKAEHLMKYLMELDKVLSSVSVTVQEEDVYLHPDFEFWTYTHC